MLCLDRDRNRRAPARLRRAIAAPVAGRAGFLHLTAPFSRFVAYRWRRIPCLPTVRFNASGTQRCGPPKQSETRRAKMTYQTISTTWVESIAAAATLALGVLIAGDAYLQHESQQRAAAPLVRLEAVTISAQRGLVRLEPVTITAQRDLVRLEPVTITGQRTVHSVHAAQAAQAAVAHRQRL